MVDAMPEETAVQNKLELEARAEALLKRLRRHNSAETPLTEFEIRSILKEARTIGTMNLSGAVATDALDRINLIIEQAVAEAKITIADIDSTWNKRRG